MKDTLHTLQHSTVVTRAVAPALPWLFEATGYAGGEPSDALPVKNLSAALYTSQFKVFALHLGTLTIKHNYFEVSMYDYLQQYDQQFFVHI